MTTALRPVSVRTEQGRLVAECTTCDLALVQHEEFDRDIALGTLFSHHPESPLAIHRQFQPDGWEQHPLR